MDELYFLLILLIGILFVWGCVRLILNLIHYCLDIRSNQKQKRAERTLIITQAAIQNSNAEKRLAEARKI